MESIAASRPPHGEQQPQVEGSNDPASEGRAKIKTRRRQRPKKKSYGETEQGEGVTVSK